MRKAIPAHLPLNIRGDDGAAEARHIISSDAQIALQQRAKAGDRKSLDDLIRSQAGLVRQLAKSYAEKVPGVELDDLIQEGNLAVMSAVKYFKPEKGFRFTTYAGDCVKKRFFRHLQHPNNRPLGQQEPAADDERGRGPLQTATAPVPVEPADN